MIKKEDLIENVSIVAYNDVPYVVSTLFVDECLLKDASGKLLTKKITDLQGYEFGNFFNVKSGHFCSYENNGVYYGYCITGQLYTVSHGGEIDKIEDLKNLNITFDQATHLVQKLYYDNFNKHLLISL